MTTQQIILSLVLATMVFSVALELKLADFTRVAQSPRAVVCGLIPQFVLLPVGTWLATLVLDLPPNIEAAMILVAACPAGSLSNVVTHFGRGNTALSVSISAVAAVMVLWPTAGRPSRQRSASRRARPASPRCWCSSLPGCSASARC